MLLPDGIVLMHGAAPYDASKAHEYYLRYRKLHPRDKGVVDAGKSKSSFTVTESGGHTVKLTAQQLEEQKVYAEGRVSAIQAKLADLTVKLQKKVAAAKAAAAKANQPMTAVQKAAAAQASANYRAAHKQQLANKAKAPSTKAKAKATTAKKTDTLKSLTVDIAVTKADLKDAVDRQRQLTTAKQNG